MVTMHTKYERFSESSSSVKPSAIRALTLLCLYSSKYLQGNTYTFTFVRDTTMKTVDIHMHGITVITPAAYHLFDLEILSPNWYVLQLPSCDNIFLN